MHTNQHDSLYMQYNLLPRILHCDSLQSVRHGARRHHRFSEFRFRRQLSFPFAQQQRGSLKYCSKVLWFVFVVVVSPYNLSLSLFGCSFSRFRLMVVLRRRGNRGRRRHYVHRALDCKHHDCSQKR